jgi:RNA polymerase sigma factor (sigma-70 family)
VIIITAHGDVPAARTAFRAEAVDFLEKPFDQRQICSAIEAAFAIEERRLEQVETQRADAAKLARLTPREREVLDAVAQGLHAKEIGAALEISPRTVEVHKTRIMDKLGARNVAELVRFSLAGSGRK